MNKYFLLIMLLFETQSAILKKTNKISEKEKDNRKLFFETAYNANQQSFEQTERIKEIYRQEYRNAMNNLNSFNQMEDINQGTLEEIHARYGKAINNIKKAKFFLEDKMENIYNNFIMPGKWFY